MSFFSILFGFLTLYFQTVNSYWVGGFTYLTNTEWTTVTTLASGFTSDNVIVLLGVPEFLTYQNYSIIPRLQALPTFSAGKISFKAMLHLPTCKTNPPTLLGKVPYFIMDVGNATEGGLVFRAGRQTHKRDGSTSRAIVSYPINTFPGNKVGAVGQLMTMNDVNKFLSIRLSEISSTKAEWVFSAIGEETFGYLIFNTEVFYETDLYYQSLYCNSGIKMDTFTAYNFVAKSVGSKTLTGKFTTNPGLFGTFSWEGESTFTASIESITLTSGNQIFKVNAVKDCSDKHATETFYGFLLGPAEYQGQPDYNDNTCNAAFDLNPAPSFAPSSTPTLAPTLTSDRPLTSYGLQQAFVEPFDLPEGGGYYGSAHDLSGDGHRLVVGCKTCGVGDSALNPGAVYIFTDLYNKWEVCQTLAPPNDLTTFYGGSVSINQDGSVLVVASMAVSNTNNFRGIFIYKDTIMGSKNCTLNLTQMINLVDLQEIDTTKVNANLFEVKLSGDGNTLAVGIFNGKDDYGRIKLYRNSGAEFVEVRDYFAPEISADKYNSATFGSVMSISHDGSLLAVGNDYYEMSIAMTNIPTPSPTAKPTRIPTSKGSTKSPTTVTQSSSKTDFKGRVDVYETLVNTVTPAFTFLYYKGSGLGASVALSGDGSLLAFGMPELSPTAGISYNGLLNVFPLQTILSNRDSYTCHANFGSSPCCYEYLTGNCTTLRRKRQGSRTYDYFGSSVAMNYDGSLLAATTKTKVSGNQNIVRLLSTESMKVAGEPDEFREITTSENSLVSGAYIIPVLSNDAEKISYRITSGQNTDSGSVSVYKYVGTASPTHSPTFSPTSKPSRPPTFRPSRTPTFSPTYAPSTTPTFKPSAKPSVVPTFKPSSAPTFAPSSKPSTDPTFKPSSKPSSDPTFKPSASPTFAPSSKPSTDPTFKPSSSPTLSPTELPTPAGATNPPSPLPTLFPTKLPSVSPTFTPSVFPSLSPTPRPTASPSTSFPTGNCGNICLNISLVDLYGDGWDGAELNIIYGDVISSRYSPSCNNGTDCLVLCPLGDAYYQMEISHPNQSYTPKNYWEIVWDVTVDNSTHPTFQGGLQTQMIWYYYATTCEWFIEIYNETTPICQECSSEICPTPPPPRKKDDDDDDKKKKPKIETNSSNSTMPSPKPKPKYGPPAVNLQIRLTVNGTHDDHDDGCAAPIIPSWYLADNTRSDLFHHGMLCNEQDVGYCVMCLGDGSYTIRFIGKSTNTSKVIWDFCGVTGNAPSELTFHVKKGACYPDAVTYPCSTTEIQSLVSLTGTFALNGYPQEQFADSDKILITNFIQQNVQGWETFQITSLHLDTSTIPESSSSSSSNPAHSKKDDDNNRNNKNDNNKNNKKSSSSKHVIDNSHQNKKSKDRRLTDFNYLIHYSVVMTLEESYPNIDGKDYSAVESLVRSLRSALPSILSKYNSTSYSLTFDELYLSDVTYVGLPKIMSSTLAEPDWSNYNSLTLKQSTSHSELYGAPLYAGLLLMFFLPLAAVVHRSLKDDSYETLPGDSHHQVSEITDPHSLTVMDETISQRRTNVIDHRTEFSNVKDLL